MGYENWGMGYGEFSENFFLPRKFLGYGEWSMGNGVWGMRMESYRGGERKISKIFSDRNNVKYSKSFQIGISDGKNIKYSKSFQTRISDRNNVKYPKSFQTRIFNKDFIQ